MDKEFILAEIRRTAELNGGKALGHRRFRDETGICEADWKARHWVRWNDAVREAGLSPNELNGPLEQSQICEAYARYAIKLGKLPVQTEVKMIKRTDLSFPSWDTFTRNGGKKGAIVTLAAFCREHAEYSTVLQWCEENLEGNRVSVDRSTEAITKDDDGFVYLAKTRRGYKIGRTDDWEQRLRQIRLHNADDVQLVHLLKTDDPSGVEAYWHRRFKTKRVVTKSKTGRRRNWYNLTADDVRAFKRWRQI